MIEYGLAYFDRKICYVYGLAYCYRPIRYCSFTLVFGLAYPEKLQTRNIWRQNPNRRKVCWCTASLGTSGKTSSTWARWSSNTWRCWTGRWARRHRPSSGRSEASNAPWSPGRMLLREPEIRWRFEASVRANTVAYNRRALRYQKLY